MARRGGRGRRLQISQCDRCLVAYCRQMEECARLECEAYGRGERYWCEDYDPPWHERVASG